METETCLVLAHFAERIQVQKAFSPTHFPPESPWAAQQVGVCPLLVQVAEHGT